MNMPIIAVAKPAVRAASVVERTSESPRAVRSHVNGTTTAVVTPVDKKNTPSIARFSIPDFSNILCP
jgi:hypothetical protein